MFQYIAIENAAYSEGSAHSPDVLILNLGAGRGIDIQGCGLLRVMHALQSRLVVSLSPGETNDLAMLSIEVSHRAGAGR